ncbi:hypothetical protein ZWY2020_018642 [Hordeum vulgare]|nr:hypothetical protein ZWY2020_018642 [Hordeum vulgare]
MVLWDDGDSSESSAVQYISSLDSLGPIPATIDDPNHSGDDDKVMYEHGKPAKKFVAFEGISTRRRFIACGIENALHKLWLMYEDSQHFHRIACVTYENLVEDVNNILDFQDNLPQPHTNIGEDNNSIHVDKSNGVYLNEQLVVKDAEITKLKDVIDQLKFIHVAQGNVIMNLKFNHLKEKEKMISDNRTFKFCFADFKKEKEKLCIENKESDCIIAHLVKYNQKLVR